MFLPNKCLYLVSELTFSPRYDNISRRVTMYVYVVAFSHLALLLLLNVDAIGSR